MQSTDPQTPTSDDMAKEIAGLRREVERLNSHRFITVHNSLWRLFALRFASGLFTGLGTVIGATVLVSLLVVWLQQIDWLPIIGDWAGQIADQIQLDGPGAAETETEGE